MEKEIILNKLNLEGIVTEKHAQEIFELLKQEFKEVEENTKKEIVVEMKRLPIYYSKELGETIAYEDVINLLK